KHIHQINEEIETGTEGQTDLDDPEVEQFVRDAVAPCKPIRDFAIKKDKKYAASHNKLHIEYTALRSALDLHHQCTKAEAALKADQQEIAKMGALIAHHQKAVNQNPFKKWLPSNGQQKKIYHAQQGLDNAVALVTEKTKIVEVTRFTIDNELNRH